MMLQFILNGILIITGFYLGKKSGIMQGYNMGAKDMIDKIRKGMHY